MVDPDGRLWWARAAVSDYRLMHQRGIGLARSRSGRHYRYICGCDRRVFERILRCCLVRAVVFTSVQTAADDQRDLSLVALIDGRLAKNISSIIYGPLPAGVPFGRVS
jgi:hypothetical protein